MAFVKKKKLFKMIDMIIIMQNLHFKNNTDKNRI